MRDCSFLRIGPVTATPGRKFSQPTVDRQQTLRTRRTKPAVIGLRERSGDDFTPLGIDDRLQMRNTFLFYSCFEFRRERGHSSLRSDIRGNRFERIDSEYFRSDGVSEGFCGSHADAQPRKGSRPDSHGRQTHISRLPTHLLQEGADCRSKRLGAAFLWI